MVTMYDLRAAKFMSIVTGLWFNFTLIPSLPSNFKPHPEKESYFLTIVCINSTKTT